VLHFDELGLELSRVHGCDRGEGPEKKGTALVIIMRIPTGTGLPPASDQRAKKAADWRQSKSVSGAAPG